MGKKKVTTEQSVKPIYSGQIEGAANDLTSTYNASKGGINQVSSDLMGLSSDLLGRFKDGDPAISAAKGWITDTLGSDPQNNP